MALLTDRTLAASSAITASTLIHIVDVNDFSQNPAGSSYKAELGQIYDGLSGYCLSDLYVSNIHSCSPLHIQPTSVGDVLIGENGGVNVGIGLTSPNEKLHVSGNTIVNSDNVMLSNTLTSIPVSNFKGFIGYFDSVNNSGYNSYNTNSSGSTGYSSLNDNGVFSQVITFGSDYIKPSPGLVGSNFYKNKTLIRNGPVGTSEGLVINPLSNDPSAKLWVEIDGSSAMILIGDGVGGSGNAYLGLSLNPDGTEMPTSNLQIGGTGTTGTFQYKDGNQQNGYLLTSDSDGNATWQESSGFTGNTSATCITDLHVSNIHSCSPLYINPLSEGDIYVGSANTLTVDLTNERVGVGTTSPSAKLEIVGSGTSFSSYSLKIKDSSNRNILSARDDNFVFAGDNAVSSYLWTQGLGGVFGFSNENGFPYLYLNSAFSNKFYISNGGGGGNAFAQINTNNGNWLIGNPATNVYGAILSDTKLYIQGVDATASNFALKVDNSASTALFYIKNDGVVDIYGTITPRVQSIVSAATVTPTNLNDEVVITAQAVALTLANPTGTAVQGQSMMIRIKDNGVARTIGYGTQYRAIGVTLPTTTVANKIVYLGLIYNSTDTKWDVIGVSQEA